MHPPAQDLDGFHALFGGAAKPVFPGSPIRRRVTKPEPFDDFHDHGPILPQEQGDRYLVLLMPIRLRDPIDPILQINHKNETPCGENIQKW